MIKVGKEIGVENFSAVGMDVQGVIANPVCTEFSTAAGFHKTGDLEKGMELVRHCQRIIKEARPVWWVIENPANGRLKDFLGKPIITYQPWWYGSPWTKKTALWGEFDIPARLFHSWDDVAKNPKLYVRPGRGKPSLAFLHKSAIYDIPEFAWAIPLVREDNAFRSLCSQGFAKCFKAVNK